MKLSIPYHNMFKLFYKVFHGMPLLDVYSCKEMWPSHHGLCSNAMNSYGKAYLSKTTYILYGIILEFHKTDFDVGLNLFLSGIQ